MWNGKNRRKAACIEKNRPLSEEKIELCKILKTNQGKNCQAVEKVLPAYRFLSRTSVKTPAGMTPTLRSISLPFFRKITVGMDMTP